MTEPKAFPLWEQYGIPASTNMGRFGYTGQTWLPEIGMYYYKARMYSPTLGRFMQTDPIGYADGMNWYAYVGNDPINFVDPLGLAELRLFRIGQSCVISTYGTIVSNDDGRTWKLIDKFNVETCIPAFGFTAIVDGPGGGGPSENPLGGDGETETCRAIRESAAALARQVPGFISGTRAWHDIQRLQFHIDDYNARADENEYWASVLGYAGIGEAGRGVAVGAMNTTAPSPSWITRLGGALRGAAPGIALGAAAIGMSESASYQRDVAEALEARRTYLVAIRDGTCRAGQQ